MRAVLTLAALVALAAPPQAQALYRPVGGTGFGLAVGTALGDDVTDVAGAAIATLAPSFDLAVSLGRAELGRRTATTVGGTGTLWVQRATPTRAGLRFGATYLDADGRTGVLANVGAVVGRQADFGPRTILVPSLAADVILVASDDFGSGVQTTVTAEAALVYDLGDARVHAGPSVGLNSETSRLAFGISGGVLF